MQRRHVSCLAATLLWSAGCGDPAQPTAPPPPRVTVVEAVVRDVPREFEISGRLQAVNTVDLRARVEGELVRRTFSEGTNVFRQQLLLQIDPAPYQAEVDRLAAQLARAGATLSNARRELAAPRSSSRATSSARRPRHRAHPPQEAAEADRKAAKASLERAHIDLGYTEIRAPSPG